MDCTDGLHRLRLEQPFIFATIIDFAVPLLADVGIAPRTRFTVPYCVLERYEGHANRGRIA